MKLWIVTATRGRPAAVYEQANCVLPQMDNPAFDRWCIVEDICSEGAKLSEIKFRNYPRRYLIRHICRKGQFKDDHGPNACKAIGCSIAPDDYWIVELDDHDFLLPGALNHIRKYAAEGYQVMYGWSLVDSGGEIRVEELPPYEPMAFRTGKQFKAIGLRAYRSRLCRAVGGWPLTFPCGDVELMALLESALMRGWEESGERIPIACISEPIVYRGTDPASVQRDIGGWVKRARMTEIRAKVN